MKRVLVSVKSVQRDMDGKDTVVELISPGTSHEKGNAQYVRYEESSVTGLDGVKTTIKIHDDSIVLLRTGAVNMRHQYVRGEEREAVYETPYGDDISVEGEWQFYNQLDIDVREDIEHGHEGNPEIGD